MKNNIVNVRFSDLDYFMLKSVCDDMGVSLSDFVRSTILAQISSMDDSVELARKFYATKS